MCLVTYEDTDGGEVLPDSHPVVERERHTSQHEFDVLHEVVDPVNPADGYELREEMRREVEINKW